MPEHAEDELKVWNIKDFPVRLRSAVTDRAARQGVTVAEWLTAYFTAHDLDDEAIQVNLSQAPRRNGGSHVDIIDDLTRLVEAACRFTELREKMPRPLSSSVQRALRQEVDHIAPPPPRKERQLALAPPEEGTIQ